MKNYIKFQGLIPIADALFFFDDADPQQTKQAYERASFRLRRLQGKLSVYSRPPCPGPWRSLPTVMPV